MNLDLKRIEKKIDLNTALIGCIMNKITYEIILNKPADQEILKQAKKQHSECLEKIKEIMNEYGCL